jgi:hypothetical protein
MTIRVVLPVRTPPAKVNRRVTRVSTIDADVVIGLVDNGKGMAEEILVAAAGALRRPHVLQKKPSASRAMTLERRAELLARSRLVLTGVGD